MKKLEYLKQSYLAKRYLYVDWWIRALSEFFDPPGRSAPTEPWTLVKQPWGIGIIKPDGSIEKLDDYSGKGPVFKLTDKVEITNEWLVNVETPLTTDFGILGANALLLSEVFGKKIPYMNKEVSIPAIEAIVSVRLANNPKPGEREDPTKIYVYEYLNLNKGIELITSIMELFTIALTEKNILAAPGVDAFRNELLKDPNLDLNDPIQLANFEAKLLAYDAEYLKDDPSFGKFASGKILKDSRKKLFLSQGAEGGFSKDGSIVGIATPLSHGIPRDPEKYVASINGSRAGSFSRGSETMEGGVAAKKMLAASNNYVIVQGDCGSKMGIERLYTSWLVNSLRGRTVISGKTQVQLDVNADVAPYLGQFVRTRSPMYCQLPGEQICSICAGAGLSRYETGISIPLTEISHGILIARMKAMHTNSLTVNDFDLETVFT